MSKHINPDKCIACTTCVVHCPVAEATPDFLGPRMIGPAYERFRLAGLAEDPSLHYCANCKNCDISCPQDVPVSSINMLARAKQCRKQFPGLRDWLLAHGDIQARWLRLLPAALKNWGMLNPVTRFLLDQLGIDKRAPLPPFARHSFRRQFRQLHQPSRTRRIAFFPGCYVDTYDPQTGMDIVWLLNRAGYEVIVPEHFSCCGLPMISNGFWQDARAQAQRNMATLASLYHQGLPVLTGCPSCALMFRHDLPEFFPEIAEQYGSPRLEDAQAFLLDSIDRGDLVLPLPSTHLKAPLRILYHAPCHLRAQGQGLPGLELLQLLPGVDVHPAREGCCGISGSYGFKKENYAISQAIGAALFATIRKSGVRLVASECGTCRVQIQHGSGCLCLHPASIARKILEESLWTHKAQQ